MTSKRPLHRYCCQIIGPGPKFCDRTAFAPDPRNPTTSSLCAAHLNEVETEIETSALDDRGPKDG